jgi:hypothetical protein
MTQALASCNFTISRENTRRARERQFHANLTLRTAVFRAMPARQFANHRAARKLAGGRHVYVRSA